MAILENPGTAIILLPSGALSRLPQIIGSDHTKPSGVSQSKETRVKPCVQA